MSYSLDRKKCGCHKDCKCTCHDKDQKIQDCCKELIDCLKEPKDYCCGNPVSNSVWEVTKDRHTGQRNISVVEAQSPAHLELKIKTGCTAPQGNAQISIEQVPVPDAYWLSILKGKKDHGYKQAAVQKSVMGIMTPTGISKQNISFQGVSPEVVKPLLHQSLEYERTCDEKETFLYMHIDDLRPGECVVFRVIQRFNGKISGGCTVIAKKD